MLLFRPVAIAHGLVRVNGFVVALNKVPEEDDWIACETGVESFTIYYNSEMQDVDGSEREFTISGLKPCSKYQFSISASNAEHGGLKGPTKNVSTTNVGKCSWSLIVFKILSKWGVK